MLNHEVLKGTPIHKSDGARWTEYRVANGVFARLTEAGRHYTEENPDVIEQLFEYREAVVAKKVGQAAVRGYFNRGTNAKIYTLGEELLVKESFRGMSMVDQLDRMDNIKYAIESQGVPRWIDVPDYYGLLHGPKLKHEYILMQRIGCGTNVSHVIEPDQNTEIERRGVESILGPISDIERLTVEEMFKEAHSQLENALAHCDFIPGDQLTDWSTENVVVERPKTPVGGKQFRLWVIDQ